MQRDFKKYMLLLVGVLLSFSSMGQKLKPGVFDFGKVKLWNNPTATFTFTNTSTNRVLFLPTPYQRNLYIDLPKGYVEPGQSITIKAIFYTEERGKFNVSQPLYVNGSPDPLLLTLRGKIASFHPNALTACPVMGQEKILARNGITQVMVVDQKTGEVLTGVDILLTGTTRNYFIEKTRHQTVPLKNVPIGLYEFDVTKPGYEQKRQVSYINKNTNTIIVELIPTRSYGVIDKIETPPSSEEDEVIEIEKPRETEQDAIERIRQMMDERFKGKRIIEGDVVVVQGSKDTTNHFEDEREEKQPNEGQLETTSTENIPDFSGSGELNSLKYRANNIVFLIDESSSMMLKDKMTMLQQSMKSMVKVLRKQDLVTIVVYSRTAEVKLQSVSGDQKELIYKVIDQLTPQGRSYGAEGLVMSYKLAKQSFIQDGNNEVILATDGLFNSPKYTHQDIYDMAKSETQNKISTTVIGFGRDKNAMIFMKDLATNGEGSYMHVTNNAEAERALLTEIMERALR